MYDRETLLREKFEAYEDGRITKDEFISFVLTSSESAPPAAETAHHTESASTA